MQPCLLQFYVKNDYVATNTYSVLLMKKSLITMKLYDIGVNTYVMNFDMHVTKLISRKLHREAGLFDHAL